MSHHSPHDQLMEREPNAENDFDHFTDNLRISSGTFFLFFLSFSFSFSEQLF